MTIPSRAVYREPNRNVVIKTGDFAARFYNNYGGALLEFWKDNYPLLTDPWPGSGVINVIDGQSQDLSYTSPDGITPYPLTNNPFLADGIDHSNPSYTLKGCAPSFWLSHEAIDDYSPDGDRVWATPYSLVHLWSGGVSVAFVPSPTIKESMFLVHDTLQEIQVPTLQNLKNIAKFRSGLVAAKVKVYLRNSDSNSYGGIVTRLNPGQTPRTNHSTIFTLPHIQFVVNRKGRWVVKRNNITIKEGRLSFWQVRRLKNNSGLEISIRSGHNTPSKIEFYVESSRVYTQTFTTSIYDHGAGLVASTNSGKIDFDSRVFIDTSITMTSVYTPTVDQDNVPCIRHNTTYRSLIDEPFTLYRAGGGAFLNTTTFPVTNRQTAYLDGTNTWREYDGILALRSAKAFYAGSIRGEMGLSVRPIAASITKPNQVTIDTLVTGQAHALVSKAQINNSYVIMFNTNGPNQITDMLSTTLTLDWYNHRITK